MADASNEVTGRYAAARRTTPTLRRSMRRCVFQSAGRHAEAQRMHSSLMPIALLIALTSIEAFAGGRGSFGGTVTVHGHVRKDGTYVAPHHRTAPDKNFNNNWSTDGNVNPYTGESGKLTQPPLRDGSTVSSVPGYLYVSPSSQAVAPSLAIPHSAVPAGIDYSPPQLAHSAPPTDYFSPPTSRSPTSVTTPIPDTVSNSSRPPSHAPVPDSHAPTRALSYLEVQKARDVERANFWLARGHSFNPSYMSAYSMDQKVRDIERADHWKQRGYTFNPEYMSAYSMDQKVKDIERSRYWKSKGHEFNPEYMSAYSMDKKVRDIERAQYWKQRGFNFDPSYMSAYSMDLEAAKLPHLVK